MKLKFLFAGILASVFIMSCKIDVDLNDSSLSASKIKSISNNINSVMMKQVDCWNNGKIDCFTSYYADTTYSCIMGSEGPICGRDSITAVYQTAYPKNEMGKLHFDEISIEVLEQNIALVRGKFILEYSDKPMDSGWFTLVFQKIKGDWLIVADQTG